jgi:hypothetical protein
VPVIQRDWYIETFEEGRELRSDAAMLESRSHTSDTLKGPDSVADSLGFLT